MEEDRSHKIKYAGSLEVGFDQRKMTLDFSDAGIEDYADGPLGALVVPAKFEVCGNCQGRGTSTAWAEAEGGGFTASEWAECCDGDPDFAEDYWSGKYDRACPECHGDRVVPEIDLDPNHALVRAVEAVLDAIHASYLESEAERRIGA